ELLVGALECDRGDLRLGHSLADTQDVTGIGAAGSWYPLADVSDVSVRAHDAVLKVDSVAREHPIKALHHRSSVVRMNQVQESLSCAPPLVGRDSMDGEHLIGQPVDAAGGEIPLPVAHMRDGLCLAEQLFAPGEALSVPKPPNPIRQVSGQVAQGRD